MPDRAQLRDTVRRLFPAGRRAVAAPSARVAPAMPLARLIVLLVAAFAFSWQGLLAETHHHGFPGVASASLKSGATARPDAPGGPADSPANCPICRELAHAANYLAPPPPVALAAPSADRIAPIAVVPPGLARHWRSHRWRSRAPPIPLQA